MLIDLLNLMILLTAFQNPAWYLSISVLEWHYKLLFSSRSNNIALYSGGIQVGIT